jgi:hypothetical protein
VTYDGDDVVVGENGDGTFTGDSKTRTGTITFTKKTGFAPVRDLNLTRYIPKPEFGKSPETYDGAEYKVTVTWSPNVPKDGFTYFDKYTATVTLTPQSGFTFTGAQVGKFFHADADAAGVTEHAIKLDGTEVSFKIGFPEPPDNVVVDLDLPFSGVKEQKDSVIDVIREAKAQGKASLTLTLKARVPEQVQFGAHLDLGSKGLVLNSSNSPAELTIDGGGRIIELTGYPYENPLITVENGVTLTLNNITITGRMPKDIDNIIAGDYTRGENVYFELWDVVE